MTAARDIVTALTELAEYLHSMSRLGYSKDTRDAYADAATRVDQVNIGPAFGAVLAEMDAGSPPPEQVKEALDPFFQGHAAIMARRNEDLQ